MLYYYYQQNPSDLRNLFIAIMAITVGLGCSSSKNKRSSNGDQHAMEVVAQEFSSSADTTGLSKFTGQLNYTGNEPFATPALLGLNENTYKLTADSTFMTETFQTLNGNMVSIYGKLRESDTSTLLEVHFYELRD